MSLAGFVRVAALALTASVAACGGAQNGAQNGPPGQAAQPARRLGSVTLEEFTLSAKADGINLYLRNKHPVEYYDAKPGKTVLFLHGATFPGSVTFDLPVDDASWMEWMAKRGYDVYALDLRGYGKSTRPPAMAQAADAAPPQVDGEAALDDIAKTVDFIVSRRNVERVVLVGWSWGATLAGSYAAKYPGRVDRLVLYAPQWLSDSKPAEDTPKLGAWREVPLESIRNRWTRDVPGKERGDLVSRATVDMFLAALKETDPEGARQTPAVLKVPNGAVADWLASWGAGKAYWRPDRVSAPTMVIQGEWDAENPPDQGLSVFAGLTGAPDRRYVLLGEATHTVLFEKNRYRLFRAVQDFLEEK